MQFDFVLVGVDLVEVLGFQFQFDCCLVTGLQMAPRFWVGKAQKMTIFTPCIMVIEWEQTMFEWFLSTLSFSSF